MHLSPIGACIPTVGLLFSFLFSSLSSFYKCINPLCDATPEDTQLNNGAAVGRHCLMIINNFLFFLLSLSAFYSIPLYLFHLVGPWPAFSFKCETPADLWTAIYFPRQHDSWLTITPRIGRQRWGYIADSSTFSSFSSLSFSLLVLSRLIFFLVVVFSQRKKNSTDREWVVYRWPFAFSLSLERRNKTACAAIYLLCGSCVTAPSSPGRRHKEKRRRRLKTAQPAKRERTSVSILLLLCHSYSVEQQWPTGGERRGYKR